MKRFIAVGMLILALDRTIGFTLGRMYQRTLTGETGGLINLALRKNPDVLILGSSRARHHIVPAVLTHRLAMSAFNAGLNGQDFLYAMMLFDLWQRVQAPPRAVVLHVDVESFLENQEELERTSIFSYYVGQSAMVRHILFMRGRYERIKYLSSAYRFNGKLLPILKNQFAADDDRFDGYVGLVGTLASGDPSLDEVARQRRTESRRRSAAQPFWTEKLRYFDELVAYCERNNTRLILVHSPEFEEDRIAHGTWVRQLSAVLAARPEVDFLDINEESYPDVFLGRAELYRDVNHLNADGADLFSRILAQSLEGKLARGANPR